MLQLDLLSKLEHPQNATFLKMALKWIGGISSSCMWVHYITRELCCLDVVNRVMELYISVMCILKRKLENTAHGWDHLIMLFLFHDINIVQRTQYFHILTSTGSFYHTAIYHSVVSLNQIYIISCYLSELLGLILPPSIL